MAFVKRTSAPDRKDKNFYSATNIFHSASYGMNRACDGGNKNNVYGGNCTAYAYGRLLENGVKYPKLNGNAGKWFEQATLAGYPVGTEAKNGAIACYDDHVLVVEDAILNEVSDSSWNNSIFRYYALDKNYTRVGHKLLGFIYLPTDAPKPTPTPTPTPTTLKTGDKVVLKNARKFSSSTGAQIGTISGTYYIHSMPTKNNRYKITTKPEYVNKDGKVTCWVSVSDQFQI